MGILNDADVSKSIQAVEEVFGKLTGKLPLSFVQRPVIHPDGTVVPEDSVSTNALVQTLIQLKRENFQLSIHTKMLFVLFESLEKTLDLDDSFKEEVIARFNAMYEGFKELVDRIEYEAGKPKIIEGNVTDLDRLNGKRRFTI